MLEKRKMNKRNILCMFLLATAILAGSVTVYAKTGTYSTKTVRGWSCTCKGEYIENTGRMTGSTKATFIEHPGCFTQVKAYDPFANKTFRSKKIEKNSVTIGVYGDINNKNVRIAHHAYSKKGACSVIATTVYY